MSPQTFCRQCGYEISPTNVVCTHCGRVIDGQIVSDQVQQSKQERLEEVLKHWEARVTRWESPGSSIKPTPFIKQLLSEIRAALSDVTEQKD